MRLSGDLEFGARLVTSLPALGLVAIAVWFRTATMSRNAGLVAGLMLAACPGVVGWARCATLDTLFTMFAFGVLGALRGLIL